MEAIFSYLQKDIPPPLLLLPRNRIDFIERSIVDGGAQKSLLGAEE